MRKSVQGFNLVELLIAVVIVGVLAAIAVPAYTENVSRSRRAEAQVALAGYAHALERFYTANNGYKDVVNSPAQYDASTANLFPSTVPAGTSAAESFYNITLTITADGQGYTLTSAPANAQASDKCGSFVLTASGQKSLSGQKSGVVAKDCWSS